MSQEECILNQKSLCTNGLPFSPRQDYGMVESQPILIYACDLGPKHSGSGPYMFRKSYSKNYIWGQLISWFRQTSTDPGATLVQDRRGCLMLPDISSCYARSVQHDFRCGYSNKDRKRMISHMVCHHLKPQTISQSLIIRVEEVFKYLWQTTCGPLCFVKHLQL